MLCHPQVISFSSRSVDPRDTHLADLESHIPLYLSGPRLGGDNIQSFRTTHAAGSNGLCRHEGGARSVAGARVLASKFRQF